MELLICGTILSLVIVTIGFLIARSLDDPFYDIVMGVFSIIAVIFIATFFKSFG